MLSWVLLNFILVIYSNATPLIYSLIYSGFLKIMFCSENGENRPNPGFFECIGKFSFFLRSLFFISLVYNESLYYCNSCMLEQISYLGKFWFLRYGPKCSWPIRLRDFSINRRTLKLAVSHKKLMKQTDFWCVHPTIFWVMAH